MNVEEAIEALMDLPMTAEVLICGHDFTGMENRGWNVQEFRIEGDHVLVEGASAETTYCPNCRTLGDAGD